MSGYNGYANYETWNVALWLDNDEGTYKEVSRMARWGRLTENALYDFCMEIWPGGKTPDDARLKDVDWEELVTGYNQEFGPEEEDEEEDDGVPDEEPIDTQFELDDDRLK